MTNFGLEYTLLKKALEVGDMACKEGSKMNKTELAKLEKRNARLEKKFQEDIVKAEKNGKRKSAKLEKKAEITQRKKEYQRQSIRDKAIGRAFGTIPSLKTRAKKSPGEFKGYAFDATNNCFRVQFTYKKTMYRLGRYNTPEEAHAVYLEERSKKVAEWEAMH